MVVVHGTTADHTRWAPLLPYLEPHLTVHAMDRRGRGGSGDGAAYAVEREYEDVAEVVADVARRSGEQVVLLGHSFGGLCAYGAALRSDDLRGLILYEGFYLPDPTVVAMPEGIAERIDELVASGDRQGALEVFFREVVGMPDDEFERYSSLPAWQARLQAAHTLTRESNSLEAFDPEEARQIDVPTLLLVGGESPDWAREASRTVAAALPDASVQVLEGQRHVAIDMVPEEFAHEVLTFVRSLPA